MTHISLHLVVIDIFFWKAPGEPGLLILRNRLRTSSWGPKKSQVSGRLRAIPPCVAGVEDSSKVEVIDEVTGVKGFLEAGTADTLSCPRGPRGRASGSRAVAKSAVKKEPM